MTKNDQKSRKPKNRKKWKSGKSEKVTKSENTKIRKSRKCKSEKVKKWQKMVPPLKCPKCQINDQNRHFVKSEPPGPAFFRFQGVPRDPVLRPKLDPPYFCTFSVFFHFFNLHILSILLFFDFQLFGEIDVLIKIGVFKMCPLMCNKALQ